MRLKRSISISGSGASPAISEIGPSGLRPLRAAQRFALVQELGRRLELLMLEQPPDQRLARVFVGVFLRRDRAAAEAPRLDVNERRRHDQELSGHVEVHLLHQIDVVEVLAG